MADTASCLSIHLSPLILTNIALGRQGWLYNTAVVSHIQMDVYGEGPPK